MITYTDKETKKILCVLIISVRVDLSASATTNCISGRQKIAMLKLLWRSIATFYCVCVCGESKIQNLKNLIQRSWYSNGNIFSKTERDELTHYTHIHGNGRKPTKLCLYNACSSMLRILCGIKRTKRTAWHSIEVCVCVSVSYTENQIESNTKRIARSKNDITTIYSDTHACDAHTFTFK